MKILLTEIYKIEKYKLIRKLRLNKYISKMLILVIRKLLKINI